jgi:hypothetical protein
MVIQALVLVLDALALLVLAEVPVLVAALGAQALLALALRVPALLLLEQQGLPEIFCLIACLTKLATHWLFDSPLFCVHY